MLWFVPKLPDSSVHARIGRKRIGSCLGQEHWVDGLCGPPHCLWAAEAGGWKSLCRGLAGISTNFGTKFCRCPKYSNPDSVLWAHGSAREPCFREPLNLSLCPETKLEP